MLTRQVLGAALVTATLFSIPSAGAYAEEKPAPVIQQHDITILHLVETAQTRQDHEAVARRFDEAAAQFDEQASYHEQIAKTYRSAKSGGHHGYTAMAQRCDSLAKNLKASAADARELANLHRNVAHSLAK